MEISEFSQKVCNAVKKELGEGYRIELKEVRKNNGVVLHGLVILFRSQNVAPTIYLDTFLEAYESGTSFAVVVRRLLAIYRKDVPRASVDMDFFRFFDRVKDRICYRLIGRKGNERLLEDVPHIEFLNLAICFYYAYQGDALGEGTILIHNSHMKMWETCTSQLYNLARSNTPRLFPWVCNSLEEVLDDMTGSGKTEESEGLRGEMVRGFPMKVLGNVKRLHGAICILYPGVLDEMAFQEGRGFYILPSSIHEVILLPDIGMESAHELKKMVVEVNSTQVAPEEVLSDSLYYYDSTEKRVRIIF